MPTIGHALQPQDGGAERRHQRLVEVADIELFPLEDLFYLGFEPDGHGNAGDGAADRDGARRADAYKTVAEGIDGFGSRGDNLDLMAQAGELLLQAGDMADHPAGIGEVIRRYQRYFHGRLFGSPRFLGGFLACGAGELVLINSSTLSRASESEYWIGRRFHEIGRRRG